MPATVINPHDTDDLSAASITANVTDRMVAWEASHETGVTTNGAVRHLSDQIDDAALPEAAVPSSGAVTGTGTGVHARLDMLAVVLSAVMGTSGTGYAAKYTQLASLTYGSLNAINTALSSGASAAAGAGTLVRRAADGSANFSGTVGVVALSGTGNWATTGSVTAAGATFSGVIVAGSGARPITTADGHLDASQLTGVVAAASMPALTGDVVTTAGTVATTVSAVGGKTAAQVATAVTSVLAASSTGVGNHGAVAKYDVSGGMTFDAAVTAPTFIGNVTGNASGSAGSVAAGGIVGTIAASQIDVAIARAANVPTNAGTGATGTWGISVTGSAATATSATTAGSATTATTASGVAAGAVGTAGLADGAVTSAKILDGTIVGTDLALATLTPDRLLEGYVAQEGAGTLRVFVNSLHRWNSARAGVYWPGGFVDLTTNVAGLTPGQHKYVLIEINSTPAAFAKDGAPVTGALADVNRPTKDPDTTGLAFVALAYGQTAIMQTDITLFRGTDGGDGASGGGSQVGHIHGQSNESRVGAIGLDQGYPHPTGTPSMSFLIEPKQYLSTAGLSVSLGQTTVGPISNPASGLRIIPCYLNPASGAYVLGTPVDDPSAPAKPAFSGNQDPICYIHTRSSATIIKAGDDGVNAWIEDARVWTKGGLGVSSLPVGVPDGGSGQAAFAFPGLLMAGVGSSTSPFTEVPATTAVNQGLNVAPTTTPGVLDSAQTVLGGGTVATGTSSLTNGLGVDLVVPTKTGTGVIARSAPLRATAGAIGTDNYAGIFIGGLAITGVTAFPTNPQVNETCYRSDFRAWFMWDGTAWRQMGTGVFTGAFPASPVTGLRVVRGENTCEYQYNGAAWAVNGVEQGGDVDQSPLQTVTSATMIDVTGSTVTFTPLAAGFLYVTGWLRIDSAITTFPAAAAMQSVLNGTATGSTFPTASLESGGSFATVPFAVRKAVAAGSNTYKLQIQRIAGTQFRVAYVHYEWWVGK